MFTHLISHSHYLYLKSECLKTWHLIGMALGHCESLALYRYTIWPLDINIITMKRMWVKALVSNKYIQVCLWSKLLRGVRLQ